MIFLSCRERKPQSILINVVPSAKDVVTIVLVDPIECLPVSEILRADDSRASLMQQLGDCISISF